MTALFPHDEVGMIAPPPVIYAVPLAAAWLLQRVYPLTMGGSETRGVRTVIFVVGLVLGIGLGLSGVAWFAMRGTPVVPLRPTTAIVRGGPYRFTRNPMYLGFTIASIGIAVGMNTWWALLLLPFAVVAIDRGVIAREERYLHAKFGDEYDDFIRSVRRWI